MKNYKIKSPSGKVLDIQAETIYQACEMAVRKELWAYSNSQYLKLNKGKK